MSNNNGVVVLRRDNDYNYKKVENTLIPAYGEVCLVDVAGYGLRAKVGDGVSTFAQLSYTDETILNRIDNLIIKTESEEIPIQDGSSLPLLLEIEKAGLFIQNAPKKAIKILKKVEYKDKKGEVSIEPQEKPLLTLDVMIDYSSIKPIGIEREVIDLTEDNYKNIICKARTFARMSDVEFLHSKGLCLGATLKSGIAVDEEKIINPEGLRMENEFVFHKILDATGDLYAMGHSIIGLYKNNRGGHFHNSQLVKKVMADSSNYEIVEL